MEIRTRRALHLAAVAGHAETLALLLSEGCDTAARDEDSLTPLHLAAAAGHVECARALAAAGADLESKSRVRFACVLSSLRCMLRHRIPCLSVASASTVSQSGHQNNSPRAVSNAEGRDPAVACGVGRAAARRARPLHPRGGDGAARPLEPHPSAPGVRAGARGVR